MVSNGCFVHLGTWHAFHGNQHNLQVCGFLGAGDHPLLSRPEDALSFVCPYITSKRLRADALQCFWWVLLKRVWFFFSLLSSVRETSVTPLIWSRIWKEVIYIVLIFSYLCHVPLLVITFFLKKVSSRILENVKIRKCASFINKVYNLNSEPPA